MKKTLPLFVLIVLLLLVCTGCQAATNETSPPVSSPAPTEQVTQAPSTSPTPEASQPPDSSPSDQAQLATAPPVALPLPSSEMFGLEGVDAVLYDAAVENYNQPTLLPNCPQDLLIPTLGLLGTYQNEKGDTSYICSFGELDYYDLGYGMGNLENPWYNLGGGGCLVRITLSKNADGQLICTEFKKTNDGEGYAYSVRDICGPNKELAEALIEATDVPVTERRITPANYKELLNIYLDYYFRNKQ